MNFNPRFIVEITEPSDEDILMKVWRSADGQKQNEEVFDVYNLKRMPGDSVEEICKGAAPHLFL
jgi:hypothetical protein